MKHICKQFLNSQIEWNDEIDGRLRKGWIEQTQYGRALFKQAATTNIENRTDWSEKIAEEIAKILKLPCAQIELAIAVDGQQQIPGIISVDLAQTEDIKRYPMEKFLRDILTQYDYPTDYTVQNIHQALKDNNIKLPPKYQLPSGINNGTDLFVGILMFDALIDNNDRHDFNLEIVLQNNGYAYLSAMFDNGNSLGATTENSLKNQINIEDYSRYNPSCFFREGEELSGLEVFQQVAEIDPDAANIWLEQLKQLTPIQIETIFDAIPEEIITDEARSFAQKLINYNCTKLKELLVV